MWTTLTLSALLAAMLTYLVVDSVILDRPRGRLIARDWWPYVLGCPWCLSAWVAAGLTLATGLPLLAWGAVWWGAVAGYFSLQALASAADS